MTRRLALAALAAVLLAGALAAAAATKTFTFSSPTGWASPGWVRMTVNPVADVNATMPGDQPGLCATLTACGRAPDGTLADCHDSVRCSATPPAGVTNAIDFMIAAWIADNGY